MNRTLARQLNRVCAIDSDAACAALLEQAQAQCGQADTPPELASFLRISDCNLAFHKIENG